MGIIVNKKSQPHHYSKLQMLAQERATFIANNAADNIKIEHAKMGTFNPSFMDPIEEGVSEDQHLVKLSGGHMYFGQLSTETKLSHGYGIWLHANGKTLYEGQFEKGKFCGLGIMIYGSGHFEGTFKDGTKNGPGKFIYHDDSFVNGYWANGTRDGSEISETTSYSGNLTGGSSHSVV